MERLIDVLFDVRNEIVYIKYYNEHNKEMYLCRGMGSDILKALSSEILLKHIKEQKLSNTGVVIITIELGGDE